MTDEWDGGGPPTMAEITHMLWLLVENVSEGDWTKQTPLWQEDAAIWRDEYFAAVKRDPSQPRPLWSVSDQTHRRELARAMLGRHGVRTARQMTEELRAASRSSGAGRSGVADQTDPMKIRR